MSKKKRERERGKNKKQAEPNTWLEKQYKKNQGREWICTDNQ